VIVKTIVYAVNTNAHGDQTFGNHAFPETTKTIAYYEAAKKMRHFEADKDADDDGGWRVCTAGAGGSPSAPS